MLKPEEKTMKGSTAVKKNVSSNLKYQSICSGLLLNRTTERDTEAPIMIAAEDSCMKESPFALMRALTSV